MHAKLKDTPGIYLVGFMGCGKTTVGRLLADRLGWEFVDLDTEIERRAGRKIPEIFEQFGEEAFREMERQALAEQVKLVRQARPRVVALGGGAFADARNRARLASAGVSIWLDSPVDQLWERIAGLSGRPLARDRARFEELYRERRSHYEQADYTIFSEDGGPEQRVDAILALQLV